MPRWTDDEHLIFDIVMALSKIKIGPRGEDRDEIYRRMVAEQILEHLKLSNWKFERGSPSPNHSR